MAAAGKLALTLNPARIRRAQLLARREGRSISELFDHALRHYEAAAAVRARFGQAVREIREEVARRGANPLTMRQINAEIAAVRRARTRE